MGTTQIKKYVKRIFWVEEYNLIRLPVEEFAGMNEDELLNIRLQFHEKYDQAISAFIAARSGGMQEDFYQWLLDKSHARLAKGFGVYIFYVRDETAGWMWRTVDRYNERVFADYEMLANEACLFDIYLLPKFRGGDWYKKFFASVALAEGEKGGKYVSLIIEGRNAASLRAHVKLGFSHTVAQGVVINFMGLRFNRCRWSRASVEAMIVESTSPLGKLRLAVKTYMQLK